MDKLARILNFRDLILIIVGGVIGSGIFLVPGEVLNQSGGRVGPALLVWFAGGLLSLLGALTYGELSVRNPQAGGLYIHIRDCFGALPAFLFGWTLFFAISSGAVATLAVGFGKALAEVDLRCVVEVRPRHMQDLLRLVGYGSDDVGMAVPCRNHSNASREVEEPIAIHILNDSSAAALDHERVNPCVRWRNVAGVPFEQILRLRTGRWGFDVRDGLVIEEPHV